MRGELIPNQGALINAIVLQEAKLSSEIDNIVTTNDELYRACADVYMFAKRTHRDDMSRKPDFSEISQKRVQDVDISVGRD